MPPFGDIAIDINARFGKDVRLNAALEAGVLIHQMDGTEDSSHKYSPCSAHNNYDLAVRCQNQRIRTRRQRVATSMIFAGQRSRADTIPTVGLDGGVILRPSMVQAFCGYGTDGNIDSDKPLACNPYAKQCVVGCGEPPEWCSKANPNDENPSLTCGLGHSRGGVRPWKPDDFDGEGGLLDLIEKHGEPYSRGTSNYKGSAEVVVSSQAWIDNLPQSVEAIFFVDCHDDEPNPGGAAKGTASTCKEARQAAIDLHQQFLDAYLGKEGGNIPLLKLQPSNWAEPFAQVDDA